MIAHMVLRSDFKIVTGGSGRGDALFQPLMESPQNIRQTVPLLPLEILVSLVFSRPPSMGPGMKIEPGASNLH